MVAKDGGGEGDTYGDMTAEGQRGTDDMGELMEDEIDAD